MIENYLTYAVDTKVVKSTNYNLFIDNVKEDQMLQDGLQRCIIANINYNYILLIFSLRSKHLVKEINLL